LLFSPAILLRVIYDSRPFAALVAGWWQTLFAGFHIRLYHFFAHCQEAVNIGGALAVSRRATPKGVTHE
jgi:hypothetical protein